MTYLPDGAPFHIEGHPAPPPGVTEISVGWLEAGHAVPRGAVPAEFVDELRRLCSAGIYRTRGFHLCQFCPRQSWPPKPTFVAFEDREYLVGSAEIRVDGDGVRYAAPDMIIHYVDAHGYKPPDGFVAAVLAGRNDSTALPPSTR